MRLELTAQNNDNNFTGIIVIGTRVGTFDIETKEVYSHREQTNGRAVEHAVYKIGNAVLKEKTSPDMIKALDKLAYKLDFKQFALDQSCYKNAENMVEQFNKAHDYFNDEMMHILAPHFDDPMADAWELLYDGDANGLAELLMEQDAHI